MMMNLCLSIIRKREEEDCYEHWRRLVTNFWEPKFWGDKTAKCIGGSRFSVGRAPQLPYPQSQWLRARALGELETRTK